MVSGNGRSSPNPLISKLCQHAESIFVEIFLSLGHTHTHTCWCCRLAKLLAGWLTHQPILTAPPEALEVGCWIPLLLGKKAVLAGDHQQLSACVKSSSAQQQGLDQTLGLLGWNKVRLRNFSGLRN